MAGIQNNIEFAGGFKLQASSSRDISDMKTLSTDVSRINHTGNPEGVIDANPSSLCHDPVSGIVYIKGSGTGNTGWFAIPTNGSGVNSWIDVTSGASPTNMVQNTGYYSDDPALDITFNLPATAARDSVIRITNRQAGFNFSIAQGSGQSIQFGNQVTTTGAGGSITSTAIGDSIEMICVVANTTWQVLSTMGNLNFV
jgi:hypothetical protein